MTTSKVFKAYFKLPKRFSCPYWCYRNLHLSDEYMILQIYENDMEELIMEII